MRILSPQIGFDLTLGGGRFDYEQIAGLARRGHEIRVILPRAREGRDPIPADVEARWIRARSFRHPYTWSLAFFLPMLRECRRWRPEIIRIHSPYTLGLAGLAIGRMFRIPVVAIVHHLGDPIRGGRWVEQRLLRDFAGLFTVSEATAAALRRIHPEYPGRLGWTYNGLEEKYRTGACGFEETGLSGRIPEGTPFFLFVGALIPRKNVDWLIETFAAYCREKLPGHLVLAGGGPEEPVLRSLALGLELGKRVHFLGRISEGQKLALYRSATAFLFPSKMEGFGFAVAEAMACGTPAVVSDAGALPEIVKDGVTGRVLPIDRGPEPWICAMQELVENREWRERLGSAAAEDVVRRFSWERNARDAEEFFSEVIRLDGAGRGVTGRG